MVFNGKQAAHAHPTVPALFSQYSVIQTAKTAYSAATSEPV